MKRYDLKMTPLDSEGCSKYLDLRESPIQGYGLFANRPIQIGSVLWLRTGESTEVFTSNEDYCKKTEKEKEEFRHFAYKVKGGWMSPPEGKPPEKSDFWNHSDDPNSGIHYKNETIGGVSYDKEDIWTAWRDISEGDEVTVDYVTIDSDDDFPCKSSRDRVNDWQNPELQKKYKGRFSEDVQKLIDKQRAAEYVGKRK